jgi:hypothetical protein
LIDVLTLPVLAIIQEKVNNPSPDDPFEPEIAAVKPSLVLPSGIPLIAFAAIKE